MTDSADPYDLQRFVTAQAPVYAGVLAELRAGRKHSHWIWFIFPQLRGLGSSSTAVRYGIGSAAEAGAYLAHPVLGPRLRECTRLVTAVRDRSIEQIVGRPDNLKVRSCMTLFAHVAADDADFRALLARHYGGEQDPATLALLSDQPG